MKRKDKYDFLVNHFLERQPDARTELHYANPYELFVAVCLSAQCTDKRVNMVTKDFFIAFPDFHALSKSHPDEVFEYIKSISYPNNKSKHLVKGSQMVIEKYDGELPKSFEEMLAIPGVGRKTANVLLSVLFDIPAMAVDTHVFRVSRRLGIVPQSADTPIKVENMLIKCIPQKHINKAHHWLILHGRYVCKARKPDCDKCFLTEICSYYQQQKSKMD